MLYLRARAFPALRATLARVADAGAVAATAVPAFTLALRPGVGLAEDDGDGDSFGERRCALLAEAHRGRAERGRRGRAASRPWPSASRAPASTLDAPYRDPALAGRHVL